MDNRCRHSSIGPGGTLLVFTCLAAWIVVPALGALVEPGKPTVLFEQVATTLQLIEKVQSNRSRGEYGSTLQRCKRTLRSLEQYCRRAGSVCNGGAAECDAKLAPWRARVHDLTVNLERLTKERLQEREAQAIRVRELEAKISAARHAFGEQVKMTRDTAHDADIVRSYSGSRLASDSGFWSGRLLLSTLAGYGLGMVIQVTTRWFRSARRPPCHEALRQRATVTMYQLLRWTQWADFLCTVLFLGLVLFAGTLEEVLIRSVETAPPWALSMNRVLLVTGAITTGLNAIIAVFASWQAYVYGLRAISPVFCVVRYIHIMAALSVFYHGATHWRTHSNAIRLLDEMSAAPSKGATPHRLAAHFLTYATIFAFMAWDTHQQLVDGFQVVSETTVPGFARKASKSRRQRPTAEHLASVRGSGPQPSDFCLDPEMRQRSSSTSTQACVWKTPPLRRVVTEDGRHEPRAAPQARTASARGSRSTTSIRLNE
ncbi:hypothetical protein CCYA_CCYA06G1814 [Cyanidiococcus yangmingshanensis]|nr:hypothetical protein CCYA_CCYA06G1814 [Cyanidiococcus yangmingshanensis]